VQKGKGEGEGERKERWDEGDGGVGTAGPVISRPLLSFYLRAQLANIIP